MHGGTGKNDITKEFNHSSHEWKINCLDNDKSMLER